MSEAIWERVSGSEVPVSARGVLHAFPDGLAALCNPEIRSEGAQPIAAIRGGGTCDTCYTRASTATNAKGTTVVSKFDITSDEGKAALETIAANTERIGSLRAEGNTDAAEELSTETDALITSLSGKGSIKAKKERRDALRAANAVEPPKSAEIVVPADYKDIPDVLSLVEQGREKIREGIAIGLKMADTARVVGEIQLAQRLKIIDPKTGLPDLHADTKTAKDASKATYEPVLAEFGDDETDKIAAYNSLVKGVQNRRSDVLVKFLRDLDSVQTPDEIRSVFPTISVADSKGADESYTEAVYALYESKGITLPRKGRAEIMADERRAKKALEAARKAQAESGDGGEDGEGATAEQPEEIANPVEYATAYVAKLKRVNKGAQPGIFAELDKETAEKIKATLEEQMRVMKDILAELV
jgi:hypothetical protein